MTAVPAMGVVAETMVAIVLATEALRKFGGDSLAEFLRNYEGYVAALEETPSAVSTEKPAGLSTVNLERAHQRGLFRAHGPGCVARASGPRLSHAVPRRALRTAAATARSGRCLRQGHHTEGGARRERSPDCVRPSSDTARLAGQRRPVQSRPNAPRFQRRKGESMYNGTKVLDVHGHVSVPPASNAYLTGLLASNSLTRSPLVTGRGGGVSEDEYKAAAARHIAYMDEREIDVQLIGPRPFLMLGWMARPPASAVDPARQRLHRPAGEVLPGPLPRCRPAAAEREGARHLALPARARALRRTSSASSRCTRARTPRATAPTPGMHEAYWYPLYERCQELGLPIIVHGTNCTGPAHLDHPAELPDRLPHRAVHRHPAAQPRRRLRALPRAEGRGLPLRRGAQPLHQVRQPPVPEGPLEQPVLRHLLARHRLPRRRRSGSARWPRRCSAPRPRVRVRPSASPARAPARPGDDLVPVIASFEWLTEDEKIDIFNRNPAKVLPALARV